MDDRTLRVEVVGTKRDLTDSDIDLSMPGPQDPERVTAFEAYCDELGGRTIFAGVEDGIVCEFEDGRAEYNTFHTGGSEFGRVTVVGETERRDGSYPEWVDDQTLFRQTTGIVLKTEPDEEHRSRLRELERETGDPTFGVDPETGEVWKW